GKYISPEVAEQILMAVTGNSSRPSHEKLSDREFTVMKMLASGKRVSEIASDLMLSVKTISTYRRRILDKTKLDSNAALTRYALENQLLD
ncbi:MAG: LuxR C-terminal-related transcriptional regulator, partial [Candidatus Krumholzibacteria bacterium]|nr:LuxR C-terminal-related transcriptional regulator [Candidatus Krumholzibacteria bacterium]